MWLCIRGALQKLLIRVFHGITERVVQFFSNFVHFTQLTDLSENILPKSNNKVRRKALLNQTKRIFYSGQQIYQTLIWTIKWGKLNKRIKKNCVPWSNWNIKVRRVTAIFQLVLYLIVTMLRLCTYLSSEKKINIM